MADSPAPCQEVTTKGWSSLTISGFERGPPLTEVAFPQQCPLYMLPKLLVTTMRKMGRCSLAAFSRASCSVDAQSSWKIARSFSSGRQERYLSRTCCTLASCAGAGEPSCLLACCGSAADVPGFSATAAG